MLCIEVNLRQGEKIDQIWEKLLRLSGDHRSTLISMLSLEILNMSLSIFFCNIRLIFQLIQIFESIFLGDLLES